MIVDQGLTFDLTIGTTKRIPQDGDAQVVVPPMVMPIALMIQPTRVASSAALQVSSHIAESLITRAASQATSPNTMTTLSPGLWELEMTLANWFDFQNVQGAFTRTTLELIYQGFTITLLSRFAAPGSFTDFQRLRLLLTSNADLVHRAPGTLALQTLDTEATLNAIRIL